MPNRVTAVLTLFLLIAAGCFAMGLLSFGRHQDLLACIFCAGGALSLRALSQAARVFERGAR